MQSREIDEYRTKEVAYMQERLMGFIESELCACDTKSPDPEVHRTRKRCQRLLDDPALLYMAAQRFADLCLDDEVLCGLMHDHADEAIDMTLDELDGGEM